MKGLILGVYDASLESKLEEKSLTLPGQAFSKEFPAFNSQFNLAKRSVKRGKARVMYGVNEEYGAAAVVGLGPVSLGVSESEDRDERREAVRVAVAAGCVALRDVGCSEIVIDPCEDPEAAAEGAYLSTFSFDAHKAEKKEGVRLDVLSVDEAACEETLACWKRGTIKAKGQNLARLLTETPANRMTPRVFAKEAAAHLEPLGVKVEAHDQAWAEEKKMGSFLSVTRGSDEPCCFLELSYNGAGPADPLVALLGKGITFDSGGISLKHPSSLMNEMRGDKGGGAVVVGTLWTLASLKTPVNVKGLIPLTENMPSGKATKVGDVVLAMNGKSIVVSNTDAEGRLILADALCYADTLKPCLVMDLATLTGAIRVALGSSAAGVFSRSTSDWQALQQASVVTGDRVWRMPLWDYFKTSLSEDCLGDLCNVSSHGPAGGSCTAAAFLTNFTTCPRYLHLDIAGVMLYNSGSEGQPFLGRGFSGRPTRTVSQFLIDLAQKGLAK